MHGFLIRILLMLKEKSIRFGFLSSLKQQSYRAGSVKKTWALFFQILGGKIGNMFLLSLYGLHQKGGGIRKYFHHCVAFLGNAFQFM